MKFKAHQQNTANQINVANTVVSMLSKKERSFFGSEVNCYGGTITMRSKGIKVVFATDIGPRLLRKQVRALIRFYAKKATEQVWLVSDYGIGYKNFNGDEVIVKV